MSDIEYSVITSDVKKSFDCILVIFCRPFLVTIATVKVKRMSEIHTWVILLINQLDEIVEKQLFFCPVGGGGLFSPLMHVAL